jgi:adenylylsulfate kinase-like enzyme
MTPQPYRRTMDGQWCDFTGADFPHDKPVRPLVRLVPEEPK